MRPLTSVLTEAGVDLSGWYLESARGISADGKTVIGDGFYGDGNHEYSYIAYLPKRILA